MVLGAAELVLMMAGTSGVMLFITPRGADGHRAGPGSVLVRGRRYSPARRARRCAAVLYAGTGRGPHPSDSYKNAATSVLPQRRVAFTVMLYGTWPRSRGASGSGGRGRPGRAAGCRPSILQFGQWAGPFVQNLTRASWAGIAWQAS